VDDAFLRQILAHPFDDGPRLVYADRLDERGDPRGEFIRTQIILAANPGLEHCTEASANWCPTCGDCRCPEPEESKCDEACPLHRPDSPHGEYEALRRRERELWLANWEPWTEGVRSVLRPLSYGPDSCTLPDLSQAQWEFRRGLVESVTLTAAQFFGGPCEQCGGGGCVLNEEAAAYDEQIGRHPMVSPAMPCPACRDPETGESTGHIEGVVAALFRAAPVTEVRLSDREPLRIFDGWGFSRGSDGTRRPEMTRHVIPPEVFDLIPTARDHLDEHPEAGWIRFRNKVTGAPEELLFLTLDRAHAALSVACVAYGRSSVHPPAAESKR
jgi:uncharacterized protein (TIGR02996 family)